MSATNWQGPPTAPASFAPRLHPLQQRCDKPTDSGMATAEFAVALPAVVLVMTFVIALMQASLLRHQALHAASVGARVAARGEPDDAVRGFVKSSSPGVEATTIVRDGGRVSVSVRMRNAALFDWALPDIEERVVTVAEIADAPADASPDAPRTSGQAGDKP